MLHLSAVFTPQQANLLELHVGSGGNKKHGVESNHFRLLTVS